jgi:1,4-alpha-glucan branching enzyme
MPQATITTSSLKTIEFVLKLPTAKEVGVAGSFNNWNAAQTPLRKQRGGIWRASLALPPGRHEYRFVADGQWLNDPAAAESMPNDFGGRNAVCVV